MSDSEVTPSSLLGSIQAHLDERLKSPFVGAFVVSWVIHNWRELLLIFFSENSIEIKIKTVAPVVSDLSNLLWIPLAYAFLGIIGYYVVSLAFLLIFELYGLVRRAVERRFDAYRWVHPNIYLEFKRKSRIKVDELTELASDHIKKIEDLNQQKSHAEMQTLNLKKNLSEAQEQNAGLLLDKENARNLLERMAELQKESEEKIEEARIKLDGYVKELREEKKEAADKVKRIIMAQERAIQLLNTALFDMAREVDSKTFGAMPVESIAPTLLAMKANEITEEKFVRLFSLAKLRVQIINALNLSS
ncbi:MAG: hypothetical protein E6Q50_16890 [Lysobacter sp.]|nr:MAG: hypothetical protein E6Q50_16890 [Lysobacter sp.]